MAAAAAAAAAAAGPPLDAPTRREMQRDFGRRLALVDLERITPDEAQNLQNEAQRLGLLRDTAPRLRAHQTQRFCHCCNCIVHSLKFSMVSATKRALFFPGTTGTIYWCYECSKRANSQIRDCGVWTCHRNSVREFVTGVADEDVRGNCVCCNRAVVYAAGRTIHTHRDMREFYERMTHVPSNLQLLCVACQHEDRTHNRNGPRWVNGTKQWLCVDHPEEA